MERWTIEGKPYRYEGGADPSATVDFGYKFTLVRDGVSRYVNVEQASGPRKVRLNAARARRAVVQHLARAEPPSRIVMGRDGTLHASYSSR